MRHFFTISFVLFALLLCGCNRQSLVGTWTDPPRRPKETATAFYSFSSDGQFTIRYPNTKGSKNGSVLVKGTYETEKDTLTLNIHEVTRNGVPEVLRVNYIYRKYRVHSESLSLYSKILNLYWDFVRCTD